MARSGFQVTQNVDNFLREKPSTRLHAPPGGGSSVGLLIYGGGDGSSQFAGYERHTMRRKVGPELANPYAKDNRNSYNPAPSNSYNGAPSNSYNGAPSNFSQPAGQQQPAPVARAGCASSNQYANGSNQNAGNVLTDRRTTRVHAPPGGVSQIHFG